LPDYEWQCFVQSDYWHMDFGARSELFKMIKHTI